MVARGREYIGTSLTIRNDNQEQNLIKDKNEFGSITPENAMKWDATEPNQGQFSFGGADQVANFATQNGKEMRCHTLVWYSQLPGWVSNINSNATLMQVMTNHIQTVMGKYKGKCTHWDVANEGMFCFAVLLSIPSSSLAVLLFLGREAHTRKILKLTSRRHKL